MAIAVAKRTLQNAAAATGAGSPLLVNGRGAAALQVTGTFVGTVTFEGTINEDLSTWVSIKGSNITNGTVAATATAPGVFSFNTTGLYSIRANITAYTSGSITVVGREIDGVFGPADMNITGSTVTYATMTHTTLGVTNASQLALAANANRKYAAFQNDGANDIYLFFGAGPAVGNKGLRLNAGGGSAELKSADGSLHTLAVYAIALVAGPTNLLVNEGV